MPFFTRCKCIPTSKPKGIETLKLELGWTLDPSINAKLT